MHSPTPSLSPTLPSNPIFPGWYADPEGHIFGKEYWIYPTFSAPYGEQTFLDAFSSPDLIHWRKHPKIIDTSIIRWAHRAIWAPSMIENEGRYYLFFSANDIQREDEIGGIGIAVAESPGGPFRDHLGKPLINGIHHKAQPIDQYPFRDVGGSIYLIYGGWGHCNIGKLNDDFTGFIPFSDGQLFREMTPPGYVEGAFLFVRKGRYYFMWSEGNWADSTYNIAYAMGDSLFGTFQPMGHVLLPDPAIGTGAGHHSVIEVPGKDSCLIVYHRRPPGESDGNARVTCIDWMHFDPDGKIQPVKMTNEGAGALPLS